MSEKPKQKLEFTSSERSKHIELYKPVKVTRMRHILEVLSVDRQSHNLESYKKIDKNRYVELETGEIHDYEKSENRAQNIESIKRTLKTIRNMINNNFEGKDNELFITLTYRPNPDGTFMNDNKRLMKDFDIFWKRFKRKYPNTDYLSIVEPQGNGAWHCHVLVRFNDIEKIYIPNNDVLQPMWGQGWTKIKRPKNIDNIGAYFSAYLADLEVTEENMSTFLELQNAGKLRGELVEKEIEDENGKKQTKKFVKGARLYLYPSGMNLYRCSRGIEKPETIEMTYAEVKKIVGSEPANYSRTIDISSKDMDGEIRHLNSITYEQYNLKRNKSK